MINRRHLPLNLLALGLLSVLGLITSYAGAKNRPLEENVWVVVRPVTCLGNPWEKDWLRHHKNRSDKYPRHEEITLMKTYFKKQGVPVLDIRIKLYVKGDPLCQTCGCERGDTLYLLVRGDNSPKMERLGYNERIPAIAVPQ